MQSQAVRRAGRFIGLAVVTAASGVAGAQEVQTGLLVSVGAGTETNPYNEANTSSAQLAATAELRPVMQVRSERTTLDLTGSASFRQFLKRYGLEDNYNVDAQAVTRATDRLTLRTTASYAYTENGYDGFGRTSLSPIGQIDPISGQPLDPTLTDVTILGGRTRLKAFDFGVGGDAKLNTYSSLSLDLTGRTMRFRTVGFNNYNSVSGQLAYSHQLSEFTSIGLIASQSRTDYRNTRQGDAVTNSIMGSFDHRLGANWTLSASAGMAFTRIDQLAGIPDVKYSSLTGRIRFCNQGEFSQFCLLARRSPEPSANGSVRVTNTFETSYSLRLSDRDQIGLNGSYGRTGRGRGTTLVLPAVEFYSAGASYDRRINETMTGFVSTSFSKFDSPLASRKANLGINAGVRVRFGALQ